MKDKYRNLLYAFFLIAASALFYFIHYIIYHDAHHIFIYLIGDIAFLPAEVLLVSFVLHRVLEHRDKKSRLEKLNMIVGTFFTECGKELLKTISSQDDNIQKVQSELVVAKDADAKSFDSLIKELKNYSPDLNPNSFEFEQLKEFLKKHRDFFLSLLGNPNLLEHESFTDLLMSVFHLTEELLNRKSLISNSKTDKEHLAFDIERSYKLLLSEWFEYMKHLKKHYPYLFSFALRSNPFNKENKIEINS